MIEDEAKLQIVEENIGEFHAQSVPEDTKSLRCIYVDELNGWLQREWPDFSPDPIRMRNIKKQFEERDCVFPVKLTCSNNTGKCNIFDGRHRVKAAKELGIEKLLTEVTWTWDY